ncbi:hypothetical protein HPP92_028860 [Vanilla planifolia]|uniref:Uncharacterized protein n=1 Tax=Vanilla planifolia TaxID=51239 RepID=A0A835U2F4_VANPL|nr:hypothetical protein HPP92_028860 [Vanilla planifolia]KAG0446393.1 hypothetical protein HPP92_028849 [Vanilla planifolia]
MDQEEIVSTMLASYQEFSGLLTNISQNLFHKTGAVRKDLRRFLSLPEACEWEAKEPLVDPIFMLCLKHRIFVPENLDVDNHLSPVLKPDRDSEIQRETVQVQSIMHYAHWLVSSFHEMNDMWNKQTLQPSSVFDCTRPLILVLSLSCFQLLHSSLLDHPLGNSPKESHATRTNLIKLSSDFLLLGRTKPQKPPNLHSVDCSHEQLVLSCEFSENGDVEDEVDHA